MADIHYINLFPPFFPSFFIYNYNFPLPSRPVPVSLPYFFSFPLSMSYVIASKVLRRKGRGSGWMDGWEIDGVGCVVAESWS